VRPARLMATRVPKALTEAVADALRHPQVLGQDRIASRSRRTWLGSVADPAATCTAAHVAASAPGAGYARSPELHSRAARRSRSARPNVSRRRPHPANTPGACRSLRPARRWPTAASRSPRTKQTVTWPFQ
jgi:hypothetical protein